MRQRRTINPTAFKMMNNGLKFRRRVEIPCWHHEHIAKVARIFREYADNIEAIGTLETMLNHEKVSLVQFQIQRMNWDMQELTPHDPRQRGAEQMRYVNGRTYQTNMNGVDHVERREDLDEQFVPGINMRRARSGRS